MNNCNTVRSLSNGPSKWVILLTLWNDVHKQYFRARPRSRKRGDSTCPDRTVQAANRKGVILIRDWADAAVAILALATFGTSASNGAAASVPATMRQLEQLVSDNNETVYWIQIQVDPKGVSSDYFWNGKSDLFCKIETDTNAQPIFPSTYNKDTRFSNFRFPFSCPRLPPGSEIRVTLLDDDSGGKILAYLTASAEQITDRSTSGLSGGVQISGPLGVRRYKEHTRSSTTIVPYPVELLQGEGFEIVSDTIIITVPKSGYESDVVKIFRNKKEVGTATLHSLPPTFSRALLASVLAACLIAVVVVWLLFRSWRHRANPINA